MIRISISSNRYKKDSASLMQVSTDLHPIWGQLWHINCFMKLIFIAPRDTNWFCLGTSSLKKYLYSLQIIVKKLTKLFEHLLELMFSTFFGDFRSLTESDSWHWYFSSCFFCLFSCLILWLIVIQECAWLKLLFQRDKKPIPSRTKYLKLIGFN